VKARLLIESYWDQFRVDDPIENDPLEEFLIDLIYDGRDRFGKDDQSEFAKNLAPIYAQHIRRLGVDLDDIEGGTADHAAFDLDLKDGRTITGNRQEAKIGN
jgi:hypothetical protein